MSDILIKGMGMPKCCAECEIEGHYEDSYGDEFGFFCPFGYKAYTSETRDAKRLDNCPLVEIPPHGRLVDGDKLAEEQKENVGAYHANLITLNDLAECLLKQSISEDGAPTIIEAEGSET